MAFTMAFPIDVSFAPGSPMGPRTSCSSARRAPTVAAVGATVGAPVRGAMAVAVGAMGLAAGTEVDMYTYSFMFVC